MLIIRGVNLFHTQVEDVLKDIAGLSSHYQLVVSRTGSMDEVEVIVEAEEDIINQLGIADNTTSAINAHEHITGVKGHFSKKIKDNIGLSMKVSIVAPGAIPRSEGGKTSRIKDLRK